MPVVVVFELPSVKVRERRAQLGQNKAVSNARSRSRCISWTCHRRKNILGSTIAFLLIFRANNGYKRYMKAVGYDAAVVQCQREH